ncbi:TPA: MFS transporter [Escherichia coli]
MHNSPTVTSAKSFDLTSTAFLIVAFLTGIAGALQTPTLSIFLTDEVHARPAMVGFFFTGSAVIGILVSQFLAGRSDKRGDRKSLIVFCCLLGVLACTLFAWNRNYFVLLFVGVFLSSFGSTANPQMFALAREHADKTGREAVMFSSFLRAQVSLAWVIGPPLAYALAMGFSFTVMYLSAAVAFIVCGVMVWLFLPSMQKELPLATGTVEAPRRNRRDKLKGQCNTPRNPDGIPYVVLLRLTTGLMSAHSTTFFAPAKVRIPLARKARREYFVAIFLTFLTTGIFRCQERTKLKKVWY